jgi:rRNA-processing protein FCF1
LRPGVTVAHAIQVLEGEAVNINAAVSTPAILGLGPVDQSTGVRNAYVKWSVDVELRLLQILDRRQISEIFSNPRHRDISLMPSGEHLLRQVNAEVDAKRQEFTALARELSEARDAMNRAPGLPVLVDTNLFVHCLRFDQIKWISVVGETARIIVPLRVIEELDAMKSDNKDRLRRASREALSWLESLFTSIGTGPVTLREQDGTTIEILLADRPRYRPIDPDEEVLDACHDIQLLAGRVVLVTADTGMRLRARAEAINAKMMPGEYIKQLPEETSP